MNISNILCNLFKDFSVSRYCYHLPRNEPSACRYRALGGIFDTAAAVAFFRVYLDYSSFHIFTSSSEAFSVLAILSASTAVAKLVRTLTVVEYIYDILYRGLGYIG